VATVAMTFRSDKQALRCKEHDILQTRHSLSSMVTFTKRFIIRYSILSNMLPMVSMLASSVVDGRLDVHDQNRL
jgi:hypothetical protein